MYFGERMVLIHSKGADEGGFGTPEALEHGFCLTPPQAVDASI
jgi:hypothetical protein